MVCAAAESPLRPRSTKIDTSGACTPLVGCSATAGSTRENGRRPRFAGYARRRERKTPAVAGHPMPRAGHSRNFDLEPLDGRVDVAGGSRAAHFLAQHMPGLDRLPHLDRHAVAGDRAETRKAEFDERIEPALGQRIPERGEIRDDTRISAATNAAGAIDRAAPCPSAEVAAVRLRQNRATAPAATRLHEVIRACGGISNARNSSSRGGRCRVGGVQLSIENSAMRYAREVGSR